MDKTDYTSELTEPDHGEEQRARNGRGATVGAPSLSTRGRLSRRGTSVALVLCLTLGVGSLVSVGSLVTAGTPSAGAATRTVAVSCSDTSAANHVKAPKTKFVIHAALAFGAFHHFIYKPYKAGSFARGAHGRTLALVKAAASGLFVYHEVGQALTAAQSDPTLSHLVAPLTSLQNTMKGLGDKLKSRSASPQDFESTNSQISSLRSQASASGAHIEDCAA